MDSVERFKKSSTGGSREIENSWGFLFQDLTSEILISKNPENELDHIKDVKDIDGFC